ncbi:MAG TPA: hypothetical protein DCG19_01785 [Cryomorphaceae bacterium]|nr:hypothetical protein [Owenweeksia sp.]MBF98544.1 hypothetical protein [Owenweeksia sp.]HAD96102.1 hypothetical protein [Cryomorphaceae bacterium]HBF18500.1 hypothetical protein [Cryomorphaceae bacterium]HCQ16982.1 hypothetical protein [Cryomorphaceae bacterium]|tara:strand:- start:1822 stop:3231 length:1410 start_codon:yes stop_codon:yes gene_type:complete
MPGKSSISFHRAFQVILLSFFLVRMIGILNPPLEAGHSWRQSFTLMVSRNFSEESANILYPRIDTYGSKPSDIIASEFPLFNYIIYGCNELCGYAHWYGRLINLIVSSLGIYSFFLLVRRFENQETALAAAVILLSSIWFAFSRKVMPDTFSVALAMIAVYMMTLYYDREKFRFLLGFTGLAMAATLSKIPAFILIAPLGLIWLSRRKTLAFKVKMTLALLLSVAPALWWYFSWNPYLEKTFENTLYTSYSLAEGWHFQKELWPLTLEKFYFAALHSFIAFAAFLLGLVFLFIRPMKFLSGVLASSFLVLAFFILKTGNIFPTHNYYIIPFVPVMAWVAGYGVARVKVRWVFKLALLIIAAEGIANQQHDLFNKPKDRFYLELEEVSSHFSQADEKIAIWGGGNPQAMYFAHREGWVLDPQDYHNAAFLEKIRKEGCKLLFAPLEEANIPLTLPILYENEHYKVFLLAP